MDESTATKIFNKLVSNSLPEILRNQSNNLRYGYVDSITDTSRINIRGYNNTELIENVRYMTSRDGVPAVGSPCLYISTDPQVKSISYAFVFNDNTTQISGLDGWTPVTEQWTFGSSLIAIVKNGNYSWKYQMGNPVKILQGNTLSFFNITGLSDNLLNDETAIDLRAGTDYALLNQAVESVSYSNGHNPVGFPPFFNYPVPLLVAGGTPPSYTSEDAGEYTVSGRMAKLIFSKQNFAGGIAGAGANPITGVLPIASRSTSQGVRGLVNWYDGGGSIAFIKMSGTTGFVMSKLDTALMPGTDQNNTTRLLFGELSWPI